MTPVRKPQSTPQRTPKRAPQWAFWRTPRRNHRRIPMDETQGLIYHEGHPGEHSWRNLEEHQKIRRITLTIQKKTCRITWRTTHRKSQRTTRIIWGTTRKTIEDNLENNAEDNGGQPRIQRRTTWRITSYTTENNLEDNLKDNGEQPGAHGRGQTREKSGGQCRGLPRVHPNGHFEGHLSHFLLLLKTWLI